MTLLKFLTSYWESIKNKTFFYHELLETFVLWDNFNDLRLYFI